MCTELTPKHCKEIAKSKLIRQKINELLLKLRQKVIDQAQVDLENTAATRLQLMYLCWKALKHIRIVARTVYFKRIDPLTGKVVYFNIRTRITLKTAPIIMGSQTSTLTMESSTWVRRIDEVGNPFFMNLLTEETSWDAPAHFILCSQCRLNFVTKRCNEDGRRYCILCYADGMHKKTFAPEATWSKLPVQQAKCIVCKSLAVHVCHECSGDALCQRCSKIVHQNVRIQHHTQIDYIGPNE